MTSNSFLDCIEIETGPNPSRAVIWMHGLGADGNDFAPLVPELNLDGLPAVRFIFPHADVRPVTINNGMAMRAWYDLYTIDLIRHEDADGLHASQVQIQDLIRRENNRGIASNNIVLAGFSQGSAMALQTGIRHDQKLAGIIGLSGYLPLADTALSERHDANTSTPVFLAHGTMDPVVSLVRGEETHRKLLDMGYSVQWKTYPMQHSVCIEEVNDIASFLRTVLA